MKKKIVAAALACVLCVGLGIGGTLAWLTAQTGPVVNTFTYGDINIDLTETDFDGDKNEKANTYDLVPGDTQAKDPKVTVEADSEACYLFVTVTPSENYEDYMAPIEELAEGWDELQSGVYYREVSEADAKAGVSYYILKGSTTNPNGEVKVLDTVTKADINALTAETYPTLTFQAYAVQKDNVADAAAAWAIANPTT